MRPALPDSLMPRLSEFLAAQLGLHFPRERWGDLASGFAAAARDFGMPDAESCARWLPSAPLTRKEIEILASHLTVGETYFFRDRKSFEALEGHILPELLRRRGAERRLRIWSAGCCTGEEPYSIAMLLDRLIPDCEDWNVTLLATDINPRFLRKAAEGVYGEWSFRDAPAWIRRYFEQRKDKRSALQPRIRGRVAFSYLNLADDAYPSLVTNTNAMDVIFCRNVLMYFTAERAEKVIEKFHRSLVDGGWLIVSPMDISHALFFSFTEVEFPGGMLYRKLTDATQQGLAAERPASFFSPPPDFLVPVAVPRPAPDEVPQRLAEASTVHEEPPAQASPSEPASPVASESGLLCRAARDCANQGKLAEALEWCEKAIVAEKLDPARHYLLATIRQERGEAEAAAGALKRALYLDPDFALAHFALGNLRLAQGGRQEAKRHFANALASLRGRPRDELLAESEGLTAGRLAEIIAAVRSSLPRAAA
jgi:chemotaxis protein methyltransferase CheR